MLLFTFRCMVACIFLLVFAGQQGMTVGGDSTFSGFIMGAGPMMVSCLEMVFGGQLIMFRRLLVIFNSLLIFGVRDISLVCFRRIAVFGHRCCI